MFFLFRKQRSSAEGRIIICSHSSLIVLYFALILSSIATITNTAFGHIDHVGCRITSGLFHFTSLVYFMWILTESFFYLLRMKFGSQIPRCLLVIMIMILMTFGELETKNH